MAERKKGKLLAKVGSWSTRKKVAYLVTAGVIVYGATILFDTFVLTNMFQAMHPDVGVYRARTSTILDGGLLYTDTHTETPPLVNYLLVPAQLLGGGDHIWVYAAYFSLFGILTALLMYWVLRRYDDNLAFLVGLLFILSPFGFMEAGTAEDETIVAFTVILPALLMLIGKDRLSPIVTALGIWTKMWAILLVPIQFLRAQGWKEKARIIIVIAAISAAVAVPFLILAGDDFTWFLQYYFIGNSERKAEGFSAFRFLAEGGFGVPAPVELALVLIGLASTYLYAYKKKWGVWESITLVTVVFFVLYPKMHIGYYLIPISLLLVWAVEDAKLAARCFLLYAPAILAVSFHPLGDGSAFFQFPGSWIVGLALSLVISGLLVETAYRALQKKPFVSRGAEESEGVEKEGTSPEGTTAT